MTNIREAIGLGLGVEAEEIDLKPVD